MDEGTPANQSALVVDTEGNREVSRETATVNGNKEAEKEKEEGLEEQVKEAKSGSKQSSDGNRALDGEPDSGYTISLKIGIAIIVGFFCTSKSPFTPLTPDFV